MHTTISLRTRMLVGATAALAAAALILVIAASAAGAAGPNTSFAFQARDITGSSGAVALTGGGAFNSSTHPAHSGGGFNCTSPVASGPLAGCQTGEGVRWDSDTLLTGTNFKCLANEALKPVSTSDDTVVLHADFYRAGDGIHESFNANMFVSTHDIDDAIPGVQNVWVQGVGCATATTHFSS
jgi:opacity protein-like surface antigen